MQITGNNLRTLPEQVEQNRKDIIELTRDIGEIEIGEGVTIDTVENIANDAAAAAIAEHNSSNTAHPSIQYQIGQVLNTATLLSVNNVIQVETETVSGGTTSSGVYTKTINGESLLGQGNIETGSGDAAQLIMDHDLSSSAHMDIRQIVSSSNVTVTSTINTWSLTNTANESVTYSVGFSIHAVNVTVCIAIGNSLVITPVNFINQNSVYTATVNNITFNIAVNLSGYTLTSVAAASGDVVSYIQYLDRPNVVRNANVNTIISNNVATLASGTGRLIVGANYLQQQNWVNIGGTDYLVEQISNTNYSFTIGQTGVIAFTVYDSNTLTGSYSMPMHYVTYTIGQPPVIKWNNPRLAEQFYWFGVMYNEDTPIADFVIHRNPNYNPANTARYPEIVMSIIGNVYLVQNTPYRYAMDEVGYDLTGTVWQGYNNARTFNFSSTTVTVSAALDLTFNSNENVTVYNIAQVN